MMQILPFNNDLKIGVKKLIQRNTPAWLSKTTVSSDLYSTYLSEHINMYSKNNGNDVLACMEGNNIIGIVANVASPWDSEYFKANISKIKYFVFDKKISPVIYKNILRRVLIRARVKKIRHIIIRIEQKLVNAINALEEADFRLMAMEGVNIVSQVSNISEMNTEIQVRALTRADLSTVIKIGKDVAGSLSSHYSNNSALLSQKRKLYYIENVKNCCLDKNQNKVLIGIKNEKIIGFLAYKICDTFYATTGKRKAFVTLVGVADFAKTQHIGLSFVYHASQIILKECDFIHGRVYLNNIPMARLLTKITSSYPFCEHTCCFHKNFDA
jgi:hypothetical protein